IDNDPATSQVVNLPVLTSITAPDGSQRVFAYSSQNQESSGRLSSMQLPTLGRIGWSYTTYSYVSSGTQTALAPLYRTNIGVGTRVLYDANGAETGRGTYSPTLKPAGLEDRELSNSVTTPLGDKTIYYFSVNTTANGPEWNKSDYGLPLTKNDFD